MSIFTLLALLSLSHVTSASRYNLAEATEAPVADSTFPTSIQSTDDISSMSKTANKKNSITQLQAKNTQQAIYNCATGGKGVIIPPGNFKINAEKKNGKWTGTISIKGFPGQKSGHIKSGIANGISYAFKGNLDVENKLCHFPGLQSGGTAFEAGLLTCGTSKTIKYTELSTRNTNTFRVIINCK
jgi:hypothetical protein